MSPSATCCHTISNDFTLDLSITHRKSLFIEIYLQNTFINYGTWWMKWKDWMYYYIYTDVLMTSDLPVHMFLLWRYTCHYWHKLFGTFRYSCNQRIPTYNLNYKFERETIKIIDYFIPIFLVHVGRTRMSSMIACFIKADIFALKWCGHSLYNEMNQKQNISSFSVPVFNIYEILGN